MFQVPKWEAPADLDPGSAPGGGVYLSSSRDNPGMSGSRCRRPSLDQPLSPPTDPVTPCTGCLPAWNTWGGFCVLHWALTGKTALLCGGREEPMTLKTSSHFDTRETFLLQINFWSQRYRHPPVGSSLWVRTEEEEKSSTQILTQASSPPIHHVSRHAAHTQPANTSQRRWGDYKFRLYPFKYIKEQTSIHPTL